MIEESKTTEFKVRVTQDLRRQIEHAAKANGRTMNAEIVARLMWAFEHENNSPDVAAKVLRVSSSSDVLEQRLTELENAFHQHLNWHMERD